MGAVVPHEPHPCEKPCSCSICPKPSQTLFTTLPSPFHLLLSISSAPTSVVLLHASSLLHMPIGTPRDDTPHPQVWLHSTRLMI